MNAHRLLKFNIDRCLSGASRGAIETLVSVPVRESGWHLIGTTVMGADPKTSVVDQWRSSPRHPQPLRHRRQQFPELRGDNPTATIMALALRNTRRLIAERRNQQAAEGDNGQLRHVSGAR